MGGNAMITRIIDILGWKIHWFFFSTSRDKEDISQCLEILGAEDSLLYKVRKDSYLDSYDYGFTYSNMSIKESVVVIGQTSSGQEFLNTFVHELTHITNHIANTYFMDLSGEEIAYLAGDIAMKVGDIVCKYSCNSCRNKF